MKKFVSINGTNLCDGLSFSALKVKSCPHFVQPSSLNCATHRVITISDGKTKRSLSSYWKILHLLVAGTRLYTLLCRLEGRSVTFLNCERFSHYRPTVGDWNAVYPAFYLNMTTLQKCPNICKEV